MDNHAFYIVQPAKLRFATAGMSLQARRDRLRELVRAEGAEWMQLRMRGAEFLAAVEKLDGVVAGDESLVNSAFENSPYHVLPLGSSADYNPLFGYYEPERVKQLEERLGSIPNQVVERWRADADADNLDRVLFAFRSTFAEAAKRGHAIALEHG